MVGKSALILKKVAPFSLSLSLERKSIIKLEKGFFPSSKKAAAANYSYSKGREGT